MASVTENETGAGPFGSPDWPRAFGEPPISGRLREHPEDFVVEEIPAVIPEGEGEHLWLWVEKRDQNTDWVARQLARCAGCRARDVGFAGLKDRRAVTRQWFSLPADTAAEADWSSLEEDGIRVLEAQRHAKKLKRGALRGNRFRIRLRGVDGDRQAVTERLAVIRDRGVPNYFGPQRFGRGFGNLEAARAMFAGRPVRSRNKRGLYLSAARSWIFNEVLAERVRSEQWDRAMDGEVFALEGSRSFFAPPAIDDTIRGRLAEGDIHPSGPLWGEGPLPSAGACRDLEAAVAARFPEFCRGLEQAGLKQERKALRLLVPEIEAEWEAGEDSLVLGFELPAGAFATTVLREVAET